MFGSSTGFRLPDDSVLSPDAALVRLDRWQTLTPEQRRGFAPRALAALRSKMAAYQANGARLGWLLIPHQQAGPEFPDLELQLDEIWAG